MGDLLRLFGRWACLLRRSVFAGALNRCFPGVGGKNTVSSGQKRGGEGAYLVFFLFFFPPLASFPSTSPPSISSSLCALLLPPFDPAFVVVVRFAGASAFFWAPLRVLRCCDRVLGMLVACCVGGGCGCVWMRGGCGGDCGWWWMWCRCRLDVVAVGSDCLVCLGGAASAEPRRYLLSQCVHQISTRGVAVKRGLIVAAGGRVFESVKNHLFFCIKLN